MTTPIATLVALFSLYFSCITSLAQVPVQWYNGQTLETWHEQPDVWAFRCDSLLPYPWPQATVDTSMISRLDYQPLVGGVIQVCFKSTATANDIDSLKTQVKAYPHFDRDITVLTQKPGLSFEQQQWYVMLDKVLVVFKSPTVDPQKVQALADRYCLEIAHTPGTKLPKYTWTYVFQMKPEMEATCRYANAAEVAKAIYENEAGLVKYAQPDMILERPPKIITQPAGPDSVLRDSIGRVCDLFEAPAPQDESYWIEQDGSIAVGVNTPGTFDADNDICECYEQFPLKGWKRRIAVLDFHGFGPHPEMDGRWLPGWDCINNVPITNGELILDSIQGHGIAVAGVIAAKTNNGLATAGVAPRAKIIPLLYAGVQSQFVLGVQKAVELDAEILNLSFGIYGNDVVRHNEIIGAYQTGRPHPYQTGVNLGMVIVAAAGNDNSTEPFYPAAWPETIGVQGYQADANQWVQNADSGSNRGFYYDVAGAARQLYVLDYPGNAGTSPIPPQVAAGLADCYGCDGMRVAHGTSFAAPIVSGIAAYMLGKNNELTADDVKQFLWGGAKKMGIQPYGTDPTYPGRNQYLGYGIASCSITMGEFSVGVREREAAPHGMMCYMDNTGQLIVTFDSALPQNGSISVYDLAGRQVVREQAMKGTQQTHIVPRSLRSGVYIVSFESSNGTRYTPSKILVN